MTNCNGYEMVKPCPCCGGIAYCQFDSKTETWQIRCGCGYETPKMQTQKEVCELWNCVNYHKTELIKKIDSLQDQFGGVEVWDFMIVVMPFFDMNLWQFPTWMHKLGESFSDLLMIIEKDEELKAIIMSKSKL